MPFSSEACVPVINWGSSISFCQGNSITLNAANANSTYTWSTGASTPSISVNSSGTYWVSVSNQCGTTSDTIDVIVDAPINVNLGGDRAICAQSSTTLSIPFSASTFYQWSNGSGSNQITVSNPGQYWVSATNACGTYTDTINISIESPQQVSLGPDIVSCSANSATLSLVSPVSGTLQWSDNSSGDSLVVNQSGVYWVSITNACGTFSDTISVNFFNTGDLFQNDTVLFCAGNTYTLTSPISLGSNLWSDASAGSSLTIAQPGTYWLQVVLPCGVFSDTVHYVGNVQPSVNLGPDVVLCPGQSVTLDAQNPGASYLWSNSSISQTIAASSSGSYWVGVSTGCGYVYDTVNVHVIATPNPNINDTVYVCTGNLATANAGNWGANTSYNWSNNVQTQINTTLSAGAHWVKVYNGCDTITKNFYVKDQPALNINLGKDTTFCGTSLWLKSGVGQHGNTIQWSNNGNLPLLKVTTTGQYWVSVTNACGTYTDTINVTINTYPKGISQDTIYKCFSSNALLKTKNIQGAIYQWSNNASTNSTYVSSPGKYWVTVSNVCDTIHDTVVVKDVYPVQFNLGNDTAFCRPATLSLDLSSLTADSIVWSTGSRNSAISVSNSGTYWVKVYNLCGYTSDTINVIVNEHVTPVLNDITICTGNSTILDASQPYATSYLWSNNATTSSIAVSNAGWYSVYISGICGTIKDSAYITVDQPLPSIDLGNDTIFCAGTLVLDPGSFPGASYLWNNNSTNQTIAVNQTGTYHVTLSNACNTVSDTIHVLVTGPPTEALGNVVKFCAGTSLTLNAQNPGSSYVWSTGDSVQSVTLSNGGKYWVTVTNACGVITDTVDLVVEQPMPDVTLGNDTIICIGDTLNLFHNKGDVNTRWSNGSTFKNIAVTTTGLYWVEVFNSCGSWYDTIEVVVEGVPQFTLGTDISICAVNGQATLFGPASMLNYTWSTGDTTQDITVYSPGTYWLSVSNSCYSYTDTIVVSPVDPIVFDLGPDTTLCFGEMLILDPLNQKGKGPSNYPGAAYQEITESGVYWVTVSNICGAFTDTIRVTFDEYLDLQVWDTTICNEETVDIDLTGITHPFEWFDGSTDTIRTVGEEGTYPLKITNQCGEFTKYYRVNISNCECPFFVPSAFSPDFDGVNDEFKIGHSCDLESFSIQIFNRWGQMVFESNDASNSWNGGIGGEQAPMGVYTYKVSYQWSVYGNGHAQQKTGTLTLIR